MASLSVHITGQEPIKYQYAIDFPIGQITGVFGPTGAGKTTLLRVVAGLEIPRSGNITYNNTPWFTNEHTLEAKKRGVSYVFQKGGLLSHLTVHQNVHLWASPDVDVDQIFQWCKVTHLRNKKAVELSGGQQQQVALARAMAQRNPVMLLDEPFSALHKNLRIELQQTLVDYHKAYPCTIIIVSHSKTDLLKLTQNVAIVAKQKCTGLAPVTSLFKHQNSVSSIPAEVYKIDKLKGGIWVKVANELLYVSVAESELSTYVVGEQIHIPITFTKK